MKKRTDGIFEMRRKFFTKNLTPGTTFFDQEFVWREGSDEYRELKIRHSKLAAAVAKGCQHAGIKSGSVVLYLGASHGYTPSFVSDMLGKEGLVYCVEFSPVVTRDLVFICEKRPNMIPVLADASMPQDYTSRITGVDIVFQDIAQRNQVEIFLKNVELFLAPGGIGMLALKARSVNAVLPPHQIFKQVKEELAGCKFVKLLEHKELAPFEKDHAFFIVSRS